MTKHPLTDKIIEEELITEDECDYRLDFGRANYYEEDFRTVADWQLAQCLNYIRLTYGDEAMVPFMEAMRPTQEDNS